MKIDASSVQGIEDGPGRLVVSAIGALGRALDLKVTAEGVEAEVQLAVRDVGCDTAQGFLISPPLPGDARLEFVLGHSKLPTISELGRVVAGQRIRE